METKKSKFNVSSIALALLFICLGVVVVSLLVFFLRGKTTISGEYPNDIKEVSLICENSGLSYPVFTYDNSLKKETKISAVFKDKKLETISLAHTLFYSNLNSSIGSEAHNHAAMNKSFAADGFGADAFSANYFKSETEMRLSLYAKLTDFDKIAAYKYFLINTNSSNNLPSTLEEYKEKYEKSGFSCSVNS